MVKTATPGVYRKGGRYVVVFRDPAGAQRKRSARTLAEARTLKAALTADVKRNEYLEQNKVSFAIYAREWIDSYEGRTVRGIRPGTLRGYRRQLGLNLDGTPTGRGAISFFGQTQLAAIRATDIKAYAAQLAATGAARNTVRLAIAPIRALLATAHEDGLIRANPAAGLRLGRTLAHAPLKQVNALTEQELLRVLAEIPLQHQLLAEFLAQTGLRISEALALTKADIDFGRRRLTVSRRLYDGDLDQPKSRHGHRQVPLSPGLSQRLWHRLAREPDTSPAFTNKDGSPPDRNHLYTVVRAAGDRAGISWPVGLHTFRHTCASILYRRGVPKEAIRQLLGHHSWEFTATTYLHLTHDDLPDGTIVNDLTATNTQPAATPSRPVALTATTKRPRRKPTHNLCQHR